MERKPAERDRAAFDAIVRSRIETVYRTSLAILGEPADAADATQETFVSAWRKWADLLDPAFFDAWLGRITVNSCRMQLRRRRGHVLREIALPEPTDGTEPASTDRLPDDRAADADLFDRAFARLSADDRAILILHHLQARPVMEIAAVFGCPEGTIKARLHRARAALESALARESR